MTRNIDPFKILLIHPPATGPAMPPLVPALVSGALADAEVSLLFVDANLSFFAEFCLSPDRIELFLDLLEKKRRLKAYESAGPETVNAVESLMADPGSWRTEGERIVHAKAALCGKAFYRPEAFLAAFKTIRAHLEKLSLAFYPSTIGWGRFDTPTEGIGQDPDRFTTDPDVNPFLWLWEIILEETFRSVAPDLVIQTVETRDQVPAARTLSRSIKKARPDLPVILTGIADLLADAAGTFAEGVALDDTGGLRQRLGDLGVSCRAGIDTLPDFTPFRLHRYLAPDLVLPAVKRPGGSSTAEVPASMEKWDPIGLFWKEIDPIQGLPTGESGRSFPSAISCRLDPAVDVENLSAAAAAGLRLIEWTDPEGDPLQLIDRLWKSSSAGIWNHVDLDSKNGSVDTTALSAAALRNPRVVHSCRFRELPGSAPFGYGDTTPLPGEPFWMSIPDPVYLFLLLIRYGRSDLARWRTGADGATLFRIGDDLRFCFEAPDALAPGYLDEICRMVEAGGTVDMTWVRHNLERAFLIGYVLDGGLIVANSSLKHPRPEYVDRVRAQSGIDLTGCLERGYTSVRPEYRGLGIGTKLLEGLTERVDGRKVFSIIGEDNVATQKMAIRNRTRRIASFYSEKAGKPVGVWMPEWMIDR